ncbi:aluminum-activated malate transporter 10 [Prunus yedoensis var. nudiflora]|uniref:Aluminum-activated malate transporter 10 n=1 Tax=Prunus yedoensis var. nudiflora TaxID=2094558 RepID=A0A314YQ23_PRUYE|nr:aluminum-activated malate transporter 10 [Prunus yedoensis var. nudiflora]
MAQEKEVASGMEWRITMADGSSEVLAPDAGFAKIAWLALKADWRVGFESVEVPEESLGLGT